MTTTQHSSDSELNGHIFAIGIGPGSLSGMTQRAHSALRSVDAIVGYSTYVELLPDEILESTETVHQTAMGGEVSRTEKAIDYAETGKEVALIGSGDPNVYALAGLALEILESRSATDIEFTVVPGVPAAQSCAARLGAPLVTDTVSISLSDYLVPADQILSKLRAVAAEEFAIAIYNPWSSRRTEMFQQACDILLEHRSPSTLVGIVQNAGRNEERTRIIELSDLLSAGDTDLIDMRTTVLIGTTETYEWNGHMITPRGYEQKYDY